MKAEKSSVESSEQFRSGSNYRKPSVVDEESIPGSGVLICQDLVKIPPPHSVPRTTIEDLSKLTESFSHEEWISENPRDIYLAEFGFDPEDVPPVSNPFSSAPRITRPNSGIRYHLNAMGVTVHAAAMGNDFQEGSPPAESSEDPGYPSEGIFQEGSPPDGCPVVQRTSEPRKFPTERRIERLSLSTDPQEIIDEWFESSQITLGPVIPDTTSRSKVKRLLYTYRELNATELSQIPPTDLYEHKVRLTPGTKPWNVRHQKRWPPNQKFWLDKTIQEGIDCDFFEKTVVANRELSD
jgi:hypothetical protein